VIGTGEANCRGGDGGPDGVPLGRAFLIVPGIANQPLREAVSVVERIHGDGELPTIPMVSKGLHAAASVEWPGPPRQHDVPHGHVSGTTWRAAHPWQ
jgi:hypothetical protein